MIDIAVGIKVDMRIGPFGGYVDAVSEVVIVPPRNLHKKLLIRKQEAMIPCAATRWQPSFINSVLHVPDESQFFYTVLGVMNGCGRQHNNSPEDD